MSSWSGQARGSNKRHFAPQTLLPERFHGHIKLCRVDHALALELHPDTVGFRSREDHVELNLRTAICDERMLVEHIDQILARREHVSPCAEILFESFTRLHSKIHLRLETG